MSKLKKQILRCIGNKRWIRFGLRDRLFRYFHNPDSAASELFQINFFGTKYIGDFSTFIDWSVFYFGAYCIEELDVIKDSFKNNPAKIMVDIGANIGHHSLFSSTIAKEVHSFEPFPIVIEKLVEKITINSITNIIVHPYGLGNEDANLYYYPPINCNSGTGSFISVKTESDQAIKLPIKSGDKYFVESELTNIGYIKIDVEGFERFVLRGLQKILARYRPVVFVEWNNESIDSGEDLTSFFPTDFEFYDFNSDQVLMYLFAIPGYRLTRFRPKVPGNKLAIPTNQILNFKSHIKWGVR